MTSQYCMYETIGLGAYSTIYRGQKKNNANEYVAIKKVDKSQEHDVLEEVRIHSELRHRNVVELCHWYKTSHHICLVLEHCARGDLLTILQQSHKDNMFSEDFIHDLAYDMVKALQFLHSKGIIHSNIKPSNILFDKDGCAKLCDFGSVRELQNISTHSSSVPLAKRGTPCYMAPELFDDDGIHSYQSDLWALGCVLYECLARRPPFVVREYSNIESILSDTIPPLPGHPSQHFVDLINSLLVKNPAERIQWPELCEHAFWRTKIPPVTLPANPAFDDMVEKYDRIFPPFMELNSNKNIEEEEAHVVVSIPSHSQRQDQNNEESLKMFLLKLLVRSIIDGIFRIAGQIIGNISPKEHNLRKIMIETIFNITGYVLVLPIDKFMEYSLENSRENKWKFLLGVLISMLGCYLGGIIIMCISATVIAEHRDYAVTGMSWVFIVILGFIESEMRRLDNRRHALVVGMGALCSFWLVFGLNSYKRHFIRL